VIPPPPLSTLRPGEIAISTPVIIQPADGPSPLLNADSLLMRMYGNVVFRAPQQRLGLYWETYGIAPGDSVELSVRLERHEPPPGTLRRIGFRLGIGQRTDGGVTIGWKEPSASRLVIPVPGRVPIQGRTLTLEMSQVPAGDYAFIVTAKRGGVEVSATREFWLVER
jgi:hypothetical protein